MKEIQLALQEQDAERVRRAAHRLKGSVGSFYAGRATGLVEELEAMAGEDDLKNADVVMDRLAKEVAAVLVELRSFTTSMQGGGDP